MNIHTTRIRSVHADQIHSEFVKTGWTQEELRRRTGIDRENISRFVKHKQSSLLTGARIAIAIAAGRAE